MTWVVTQYHPTEKIQYTVFKHDSHTWNLSIRLATAEPETTQITWKHVFTGLTEAGNQYLKEYTDEHHHIHLRRIEKFLIHFLQTGSKFTE